MPAGWPSSPGSPGVPHTRSSSPGSRRSSTSGTAGASGAEPDSGDGAGILLQLPDVFLREVAGIPLPAPGAYGVGMAMLPADPDLLEQCEEITLQACRAEGLRILGWRDVPVTADALGHSARAALPVMRQLFVAAIGLDGAALESRLLVLRRVIERAALAAGIGRETFHWSSLSSRTLIYKGMLTAAQLAGFYPDLRDAAARLVARARARAVLHQRPPPLGPRPAVPDVRAQRRDQHPARQRELDARAPVEVPQPALRRRHRQARPGPRRDRVRLVPVRQRPGAARHDGPLDRARGDHDDPRGVAPEPAHGRGAPRLLRVPRLAARALGRAGGHRLHRRPRHRRDARSQRAPPRAVPASPRTAGWSWRPRPASSIFPRSDRRASGGSSRAGSSSSTPTPARCSTTATSRARLAAAHPYRDWIREGTVHLDELDLPSHVPAPDPGTLARAPAGVRLQRRGPPDAPRADGQSGEEAIGSMGNDTPLAVLSERPSRSSPTSSSSSPR